MTPADFAQIHALEQRGFNAWPAQQVVQHGDWQFRRSGGFTKRANSANASVPGADFSGQRAAAEAFYARHGQPAVFRISPLAPPQADHELLQAGYRRHEPSLVLQATLACAAPDDAVTLASSPSAAWLEGLAEANGVAAQHRATHHAMVRAIALPAGFATLQRHDEPVAFGLAVLDRGAVGLYDLVVAAPHRAQGHGRTLVRALAHWGLVGGARWAYLQVGEQNIGARTLYTALGFSACYAYHYWVPDSA